MEVIPSPDTQLVPISDPSCIADARRQISWLGSRLGFDDTRRGQLEIIVTELATNINVHAGDGYLLVRSHGLMDGIEVIAVDRGPGMNNVQECLQDGFSTAGTAGNGLGAIRRLSHVFDIYSQVGAGTVVLAQLHRQAAPAATRFLVGGLCVPVRGETVCGDAWSVVQTPRGLRLVMADGLGHGPEAASAAQEVMRSAEQSLTQGPAAVLHQAHRAIASTRGAAVAVGDIEPGSQRVSYSGVGNIAGFIVRDGRLHAMVSHNGIVGHQLHKAQEFQYHWSAQAILVMHSDGLVSRCNFEASPGLTNRHPGIIAAVLHRDFSRGRDDASVVVVRERT